MRRAVGELFLFLLVALAASLDWNMQQSTQIKALEAQVKLLQQQGGGVQPPPDFPQLPPFPGAPFGGGNNPGFGFMGGQGGNQR